MALVDREVILSGDDHIFSLEGAQHVSIVSYSYENEENDAEDNYIPENNVDPKLKRGSYLIARDVFVRTLAFAYFLSFLASFRQFCGLVGDGGIWPASSHVAKLIGNSYELGFWEVFKRFPSVFLLIPISDFWMRSISLLGMILSFSMALTGFSGCYSFGILWLIKSSLCSLMTQLPKGDSDLLLLEVGILTIFLFSPFKVFDKHYDDWTVPLISRWSFRWLLYRIIFGAGLSKIREGGYWFELTGFKYFMNSVPLPTPFTFYMLKLSTIYPIINAIATAALLSVECVLSIFIIIPLRNCRIIGGILALFYSIFFSLAGNFALFYVLLGMISIFCFDDEILERVVSSKYNIFTKASVIARSYSVDLIENAFYDDLAEYAEESKINEDEKSFSENLLKAVTYESKKSYLRDVLFSDKPFGQQISSDTHSRVQQLVQILFVILIFTLMLWMTFSDSNRGFKAILVFVLALLLHVQSDALQTNNAYLVAGTTLFLLHIWLVYQLFVKGPWMWNFCLWLTVLELQIDLGRNYGKMKNMCRLIIQSFLFMYVFFYSIPLVVRPFGAKNHAKMRLAPLNVINSYGGFSIAKGGRVELIIQGTSDKVIDGNTRWRDFGFRCKPGNVNKMPCIPLGYDFVLDRLVERAGKLRTLKDPKELPLYTLELLRKLLQNGSEVTSLLETNPFPGSPPSFVRILQFEYGFTGIKPSVVNGIVGRWFTRRFISQIVPPLTLDLVKAPSEKITSSKKREVKKKSLRTSAGQKLLHVVHQVPQAKNSAGVPLKLADEFTSPVPNTETLMLTKV